MFLTCVFNCTFSIPQQAQGEVPNLTGGEGVGVTGLDNGGVGVDKMKLGVAGVGCGGGDLGVGGVSSRRFRFPKVSLFLTGVAGRGVSLNKKIFIITIESIYLFLLQIIIII